MIDRHVRQTTTWTVSECLSLSLQFAASINVERIGTVIFPVRRIPPIKHVVGADVQEECPTHSCITHIHIHTELKTERWIIISSLC